MPLILVVDDVELNIELLERKLENRGFETVRAVSGASALEAAQKHLPDLILLDVMMPVMDGSRFSAVRVWSSGFGRTARRRRLASSENRRPRPRTRAADPRGRTTRSAG
jgi:Response regulator receiver domain